MVKMESRSVTVVPITGMDKVLGYKVPGGILDHVQIGSLVSMPLLRRSELGIVKKQTLPATPAAGDKVDRKTRRARSVWRWRCLGCIAGSSFFPHY